MGGGTGNAGSRPHLIPCKFRSSRKGTPGLKLLVQDNKTICIESEISRSETVFDH